MFLYDVEKIKNQRCVTRSSLGSISSKRSVNSSSISGRFACGTSFRLQIWMSQWSCISIHWKGTHQKTSKIFDIILKHVIIATIKTKDLVHQIHIPQKSAISFLIASKKPHFHSNYALRFFDVFISYPLSYTRFWSVCIINHQPKKIKKLEKSVLFIDPRFLDGNQV